MNFPSPPPYPGQRSAALGDRIVACSQPLAGQAGLEMFRRGGNAVDAALATAITLTLVEPSGNGIGSDAFAIVWDGAELHGLNGSGPAPAAWTPERFAGGMPETGWETVTVPGAVASWAALSERFGRLPFEALFEPAVRYAEEGFLVSPIIGRLWGLAEGRLGHRPDFAAHFLPGGRAPRPGERFASADVAATLRQIAESRGEAFYRGALAERIAADAAANGAAMTLDDLAAFRPEWCGTISRRFDDFALHEIPPNGQGIAACLALGILSETDVRDHGPDDPAAIHLMIEAMKLAFRDAAAHVADRSFMEDVRVEDLLDPGYARERAALIDPTRAQDFQSGAPRRGGTVCLAAADSDGMMVSFIQSNFVGFGSGVVVPDTGISLQNRGLGFSLEEGHPNRVAGGKRPYHTIIPGFLMADEAPLMAFGVMGGMMQPQGHVQMALRTQLWGQDVQTAADAPRWRVTEGLGVACEGFFPEGVLDTLSGLGHRISVEQPDQAFGFGGAQLVHRLDSGGYVGGSDPRKDGGAFVL